ncbi:MAG TPA: hypothetical protein VK616_07485, partial [Flavitalea sp.]|nr:hypothetical protein [Flavitalea sp.]
MKVYFFTFACLFLTTTLLGQKIDKNIFANKTMQTALQKISINKSINADSAWSLLTTFNDYPAIIEKGKEFIFFYNDSIFGQVPIRVFIPKNYSNKIKNPLVLSLHGAVGQSRFSNVDTTTMTYKIAGRDYTHDIFYEYLGEHGFIVVRPLADVTKKFSWSANRFESPNPTFNTLTDIIVRLKRFLNIDDSRVYAFGHSDGSDGAFGLDIYKPSLFSGFVGYNSMLTHLRGEVYLKNLMNKPFYLVHSDLDDLRPIQQTRLQIKTLDSLKAPVLYKEYIGYGHEDNHLQIDRPYSLIFLQSISRNPFPKEIYWETDNTSFNQCDWLRIISLDTLQQKKAEWQKDFNSNLYEKRTKEFMNEPYYRHKSRSGAVKAYYDNNHFSIETSRVKEIELLISPVMVNLQNPVTVTINGKEVFNKKIKADKEFALESFKSNLDRQALPITSIKLRIE